MVETFIHVNQHKIRSNLKHGTNEPVIAIRQGKIVEYCHEVEIMGPSKVVYNGDPILPCGARVVIVTSSKLSVKR